MNGRIIEERFPFGIISSADFSVGDIINFGRYFSSNDHDIDPIEWRFVFGSSDENYNPCWRENPRF